jgi:NADH:ubiquinone oxidoreductase subunit
MIYLFRDEPAAMAFSAALAAIGHPPQLFPGDMMLRLFVTGALATGEGYAEFDPQAPVVIHKRALGADGVATGNLAVLLRALDQPLKAADLPTWQDIRAQLEALPDETGTGFEPVITVPIIDLLPSSAVTYDDWTPGATYAEGAVLRYGDALIRVVQAHTAQADWIPDTTPALYAAQAEPGEVPAWRQPTGAHDAYRLSDRVTHGGQTWEATLDYAVWAPGVAGWSVVEDEPEEPEIPAWVQPTGGHDVYALGARVTHAGQTWESSVAANVWEPGVYGWTVV